MATICTYNVRTLASESSIEDLLMQSRMIRYDVIGLAETRRRHPFSAVYETGEELLFGTCDSSGVGGVGVLVNTSLSMNIDSFEQLTTRIGRLRLERCGSTPALTIFPERASNLVALGRTSREEENRK
uniref:Endo/exonuclease/phosphatase domain-containing protein n=1 Tax=Angiostrongylus cantonensis TaxID=6313 RepID=A0A0K0CX14_ANGCA